MSPQSLFPSIFKDTQIYAHTYSYIPRIQLKSGEKIMGQSLLYLLDSAANNNLSTLFSVLICFNRVWLFATLLTNVHKSQSCLTLVHGLLQARTLEWVDMPSSRGSSWPRDWLVLLYTWAQRLNPGLLFSALAGGCLSLAPPGKPLYTLCCAVLSHFNHVQLFATLWTVACQAPLFIGFFRQENWSGFPRSPPRDLPDPGMEPTSPTALALQEDSLLLPPGKPHRTYL